MRIVISIIVAVVCAGVGAFWVTARELGRFVDETAPYGHTAEGDGINEY